MSKMSFNLLFLQLVILADPLSGQPAMGIFDNHTDIGDCKIQGFAFYNAEDQTYIIGGAGSNMWHSSDEFHYLWTTLQGDFILRAEIKFLGNGSEPHRKTGWIVKNDLNSESEHINATIHGDGMTSLQFRKMTGGETDEIVSQDSLPDVVQLERKGNTFIMSTAKFGEEFTSVKMEELPLDHEVIVGLYVCSHNADIIETVNFRNVRIIKPAPQDLKPYQEYIGSNLEIMDVETGHRIIKYSSTHSIQAPNWTIDGRQLIYNSKGRLFRYDLKTGIIDPLNSGFAIQNNNDHVISFDGTLLGISHHNPDDNNNSSLYYFPLNGIPNPIPVTKLGAGPSYLHGWSTDNQMMIFTGKRKGQFDIYTVDIETGLEQQLTNQNTLDDGPEYSPDGKYIFFNSERTGKMKIWKMEATGKNKTQLTFDDYNDWFPHISPDQKWIVFLSFPKDINPGTHPFYKHCLLRIIPYEGGIPRVIAYIYGGQGTINVPSWSPDSKKISFITNSKL